MRFHSRLGLAVLALAIFGSGMLASVAVSWVRLRWACRGLNLGIPEELRGAIGQSEILGAIDDFVAVRVRGGTSADGEEKLLLVQRNSQWILDVSRDAQDKHLTLLSLMAIRAGDYTVLYDKGRTVRRQALTCRTAPGEGILYLDANGDGVCEYIRGPKVGFHLYEAAKGWLPARHVAEEYWIRTGDTEWYRAERLADGAYGRVGEPQFQVPASQPESELAGERSPSSTGHP